MEIKGNVVRYQAGCEWKLSRVGCLGAFQQSDVGRDLRDLEGTSAKTSQPYSTGCTKAADLVLMMGIILTCYQEDVDSGLAPYSDTRSEYGLYPPDTYLGKLDQIFADCGTQSPEVLFQKNSPFVDVEESQKVNGIPIGVDPKTLEPGDRVWVKNPDDNGKRPIGDEGCNVICVAVNYTDPVTKKIYDAVFADPHGNLYYGIDDPQQSNGPSDPSDPTSKWSLFSHVRASMPVILNPKQVVINEIYIPKLPTSLYI